MRRLCLFTLRAITLNFRGTKVEICNRHRSVRVKKKDYRINFKTNYPDIYCFPVGVVVNVIAKITFTRRNVNIPAMRKAGSIGLETLESFFHVANLTYKPQKSRSLLHR